MVRRGGLSWLELARLSEFPWLVHAFSTRKGGVSKPPCAGLNLGFTESDQRERVEQNRRRFFHYLGGTGFTPAVVRQVHSSHSFVVTRSSGDQLTYQLPAIEAPITPSADPPAGDGLMTLEPGVLLTIRIADCLPVLLVDPQKRVVAAIHAGWRGALARVVSSDGRTDDQFHRGIAKKRHGVALDRSFGSMNPVLCGPNRIIGHQLPKFPHLEHQDIRSFDATFLNTPSRPVFTKSPASSGSATGWPSTK